MWHATFVFTIRQQDGRWCKLHSCGTSLLGFFTIWKHIFIKSAIWCENQVLYKSTGKNFYAFSRGNAMENYICSLTFANCLNGVPNVVRCVWIKEIAGDKLGKNASEITVWQIGAVYCCSANFARKFHSFICRYIYLLSEPAGTVTTFARCQMWGLLCCKVGALKKNRDRNVFVDVRPLYEWAVMSALNQNHTLKNGTWIGVDDTLCELFLTYATARA